MSLHTSSFRIRVVGVTSGRYAPGVKPLHWEDRISAQETLLGVRTDADSASPESFNVLSNGGQATPDLGWELLLTPERSEPEKIFNWTLFGVAKPQPLPS